VTTFVFTFSNGVTYVIQADYLDEAINIIKTCWNPSIFDKYDFEVRRATGVTLRNK
jgi:hypothetical protein